MGKLFENIDGQLRTFIEAQRLFFVTTAPSGNGGHVNLSPKGHDSLRVLDDHTLAYLDFVGSGVETIAHLRDNGRIVLMVCAFEGSPRIVRVHGRGEAVEPSDTRFVELRARFSPEDRGTVRSIIVIHAQRISDSCGFGVPLYEYRGEREQLREWCEKKGPEKIHTYQMEKNARSVDGLPGLSWVTKD